jgi:hypothetical protein
MQNANQGLEESCSNLLEVDAARIQQRRSLAEQRKTLQESLGELSKLNMDDAKTNVKNDAMDMS